MNHRHLSTLIFTLASMSSDPITSSFTSPFSSGGRVLLTMMASFSNKKFVSTRLEQSARREIVGLVDCKGGEGNTGIELGELPSPPFLDSVTKALDFDRGSEGNEGFAGGVIVGLLDGIGVAAVGIRAVALSGVPDGSNTDRV